jgi:hypothetical protein
MKKNLKKIVHSLLLAASLGSSAAVAAESNSSTFTDIEQSYAKDAIHRLVQQGILHGVDKMHFNPKGYLTRAEFVAIIVRALQLPVDSTNTSSAEFSDIEGWAAPYIISARNAGIVEGIGDNRFHPNGPLTREQAAKLLFSALHWSNPDIVLPPDAYPSFSDSDLISNWARPYVTMAAELDLVAGRPDGTFDPQSIATREMAAVMGTNLLNALDIYRGKSSVGTEKLQAPTQFAASAFDGTNVTFTWTAPSDITGIAGYDIFMEGNDNKLASTTGTSITVHNLNLTAKTTLFYVKAKDAQGHLSDRSNEYIISVADKTNLIISPKFTGFTYNQEQQVGLSIWGNVTQADSQQRVRLYASIDKATSKDITFGSIAGIGTPEIIQEGSQTQPLIIAWGGTQGFKLSAFLQYASYLNMSVQLPTTLHKRGFYSTQFEMRTVGAAPVGLASTKFLLTGDLAPANTTNKGFGVTARLEQPLPAQSNQQIKIPVTLQGNISSEQLSDLAALQLRILDERQLLAPADIQIEDTAKFGHANIVFNGSEFLIIQFDRHYRFEELQQELANGITFNLVITLRQSGSFGLFATLEHVDESGRVQGASGSSSNVIQVTIE